MLYILVDIHSINWPERQKAGVSLQVLYRATDCLAVLN
jgi:hypothetical protein